MIESDNNTAAATTTFSYDQDGNTATITDPEGNVTRFLQHDNMGNPTSVQDARGNIWTFTYDNMGRLMSETDPLNHTTSYEYDGANNRTAVINAFAKRFEFEYDDHNNLIKATDPLMKYALTEYNTDNLPVRIIDPEVKEMSNEYDNEGRLKKTIDGAGNETLYMYNEAAENPVSSYRPVHIEFPTYTRKMTYDNRQRVVRETDVLSTSASRSREYDYDAAGNLIMSTDEAGHTTRFIYDGLNRLVRITDAMNGVTERRYDDRDNLIAVQDPNGGNTFYEYDRNDRLTKVIKPMLEETIYEYDAVGNRTAVNDAKGQRIEYTYNEINRLIEIRYYAAGDDQNAVKTVEFTYDSIGNLKGYDDGTTSAIYTYDDLGRKISETINYGSFSLGTTCTYYGNGLKKTFTGPDSVTYGYTYDENNRLTGIDIPGQGQMTRIFAEADWNSPSKMLLPGGSTTGYTYDPLMRIREMEKMDPGGNAIITRNYTYSPVGNITEKGTDHGNYQYNYDDLNRLVSADSASGDNEAYNYDSLGNRLSSLGMNASWSYNENNELVACGTQTFGYDENGNRTVNTENGTHYIYDQENRLVSVADGNNQVVASYYYDPFGRRLWKEVDGTRTYFLYSDEGLIGEYDANGAEIRTYGYAPGSAWGTDALFQKVNGVYYWYQNDHLGTPQKIITTSGRVVWSAIYDSFGNCQLDVESITNNLRFAGQYYDVETGLYYNYYRYYDPKTGRYLRADPVGDGLNQYAYCFGNPINLMDPMGLCAVKNSWSITKHLVDESWNYIWYDWFFQFSDFVAGFGDTISFGATRQIRCQWNQAFDLDDTVNYGYMNYSVGTYVAYAWFAGTAVGSFEAGVVGTVKGGSITAWRMTRSGVVAAYTWIKPNLVSLAVLSENTVLSHPLTTRNLTEAVRTFAVPGTTPESPGDYVGAVGRWVFDLIRQRIMQ